MNESVIFFIVGAIIGWIFIPLLSLLFRAYLWTVPEFGIIEESWKTEMEEKIDKMINEMSAKMEKQLYYGDKI